MDKKILICDDDTGILELLQFVFESNEFTVISVSNSTEAIKVIQKELPDLVLIDLWMPVISGDLIVRQMKARSDLAVLPVLVMSASRDGESIAAEIGASKFIAKPFDIDQLVVTANQMLELQPGR